jgi:hypothetical protein
MKAIAFPASPSITDQRVVVNFVANAMLARSLPGRGLQMSGWRTSDCPRAKHDI